MRTEDLIHFCAPGRLIIGNGARHQLPQLLAGLGYRSGVIVTDAFFTEKMPWVHEYTEAAEQLGIATLVYAGGLPDPTIGLCDDATAVIRERLGGKQPDHIIALGGGSNIDLAKALSLTLQQGQPITAFTGDIGGCKPLPLIALPTTSGTGSEATPGAILLDPANATKIAVMDNALRPHIALIDPEFTYTCPPRVTADAGIDAFTHAIESFLTLDSSLFDRNGNADPGYSGRSALTMLFAKESMRLCFAWMERAYQHGNDTDARVGMAYASIYAALSYGTAGLNAGHGIAYAVAGQTHKSHGSTNAVMLPYVLDALCQTRQAELSEIASLMGLSADCPAAAARKVPVAVRAMIGRLDIPTDLRSFGVEEQRLEALIADALAVTRLAKAFPVEDTSLSYRQIVQNAWAGHLSGQA